MAMKLKVVGDRGELRDYFDLMTIEQRTGRTADEGLALFVARFRPEYPQQAINHILLGLGYFDDVDRDDALPAPRAQIVDYWTRRQREIITTRGRLPTWTSPSAKPRRPIGAGNLCSYRDTAENDAIHTGRRPGPEDGCSGHPHCRVRCLAAVVGPAASVVRVPRCTRQGTGRPSDAVKVSSAAPGLSVATAIGMQQGRPSAARRAV
jgi:hypothetical protein